MSGTGPWWQRAGQGDLRRDLIDLGPGYPDPSLLPGPWIADALSTAISRQHDVALGYGGNAGPGPLRAFVAARLPHCATDEVVTTAGTSAALNAIAVGLQRAGAAVITEFTTYDLALKIFADRGVRIDRLPAAESGIDPAAVLRTSLRAYRRDGAWPSLYLVPTYHNPTGRTLGAEVRAGLIELTTTTGLHIIEDLAYLDLGFDGGPEPVPLWSQAVDKGRHTALYSFSKVVAPGLRLGALVADQARCRAIADDGERLSGGGPAHLTAMGLANASLSGALQAHIAQVRAELKRRRDTVQQSLVDKVPEDVRIAPCHGGYFVWLELPPRLDELDVRRSALRAGVDFAPGRRYGDPSGVRLSLAAQPVEPLRRGTELLFKVLNQS
ncbi:PLP-dependent aminotransferase family protein [Kribbella sp. NPDC050820]|uniref:aminotransferase-like domain-containing protein n=1 Tax=Kribbella sp. NPDC050820 TaxID=3155408 RepID=UPI0033F736A2